VSARESAGKVLARGNDCKGFVALHCILIFTRRTLSPLITWSSRARPGSSPLVRGPSPNLTENFCHPNPCSHPPCTTCKVCMEAHTYVSARSSSSLRLPTAFSQKVVRAADSLQAKLFETPVACAPQASSHAPILTLARSNHVDLRERLGRVSLGLSLGLMDSHDNWSCPSMSRILFTSLFGHG
jgi:hypothetical protein